MRYRCEILNHGIDGYEVWLHGRNQGRSGVKDLPSCVNSKVCLSADDCLLYREIKSNQDQIDMQRDLDALIDWGST